MRILLYGLNFSPELTGIGKYSGEMVEWLNEHGHDVRVIAAPPYYPDWKVWDGYCSYWYTREKLGENSYLFRCPVWVPKRPTAIKRILHLTSFSLTSLPIAVAQFFWKPDLVLSIEPPLFIAPTALFLSKTCNSKSWLHIQDFEIDAAFSLGILKSTGVRRFVTTLELALMKCFDVVSSISGKMIEQLKIKGLDADNVRFFPNWVDVEKIFPLKRPSIFRENLRIEPDKKVLLYSGNMGEKQGLDILINTARKLQDREDILFVLCGNGGEKKSLKASASDLQNILWLDLQPMDKLNDLLNFADIHLLPQLAGAADLVMPSKLTGMLASGKPIIATAHKGTEVASVVDGRGLVVAPENSDALVEAIKKLIDDESLMATFGCAARKYAEQHLNINRIMKDFEDELKKNCFN